MIVNFPLSNQLIPLPLNDDTSVSSGNGVSVSESEVSEVPGMSGMARKERVVCLQMRLQKRHKSPFLSTNTIGENPTAGFSVSIYSTPNQSHPTTLITDTFQVMGNTPSYGVI